VVGAAADAWREAGMDGILHKPFTLAKLAQCLARHAQGRAAPADHAAPAAPTPEASEAVLDHAVLDELRAMANGSDAVVQRIAQLYATQSRQTLETLLDAVAAHDLERLGAAAHALKSMSANIGARTVATKAGAIEHAARLEGRLLPPGTVEALRDDLAAVEAELERLVS
jgi:two-component system sensor histidine kinase BarA